MSSPTTYGSVLPELDRHIGAIPQLRAMPASRANSSSSENLPESQATKTGANAVDYAGVELPTTGDSNLLMDRIAALENTEKTLMSGSRGLDPPQPNEHRINQELSTLERDILALHSTHQHKLQLLRSLANLSWLRFRRLRGINDLGRIITCGNGMISLTPDDDPEKPQRLNSLGLTYQRRFEILGEIEDIDRSIECRIQAVALSPTAHPNTPSFLAGLGSSYLCRFEPQGSLSDLDESMSLLRRAVSSTPDGDPNITARLNNLGLAYQSRFEYLGEPDDLDKALTYINQSILFAPDNHPSKPKWLNNLGISYHSRFELLGELGDLEKSISCKEEAVLLTRDSDTDKPARLSNLGISYQTQFENHGKIADIDKAIKCAAQAVALIDDNHIHKPTWLNNLGSSYRRRFERLGEISDIDQAIKYEEHALLLTPDHQMSKPETLNNLGNAYLCRFEFLGNQEDIKNAAVSQEQAVLLTPDDHPKKSHFLSSLGNSLLRLFQHLGNLEDASRAINCQEKALTLLAREDHPDKPARLNSLGLIHTSLFARFGKLADIDKAISFQEQAVELIPDNHPAVSGWLWNLGNSHVHRFEKTTNEVDTTRAIDCFKQAACLPTGPPSIRLLAARNWAKMSAYLNVSPLEAYKQALALIPQIVWLGSSISRRYEQLIADAGNIATEAAAAAIKWEGNYCLALEWLEEGRSVVWGQMMQLQAPFDTLRAVDPQLAEKIRLVAQELERGSTPILTKSTLDDNISLEEAAQQQHRLAASWDNLLEQARRLPDLHNFLRHKGFDELVPAARDSTVVVINVHQNQCDGLALVPQSTLPVHIPLPAFSNEKALEIHHQLAASLGNRTARSNATRQPIFNPESTEDNFQNVLATLWVDIIAVVLKRLGYLTHRPGDELPHVIWCTTGPLAFLPLHAAGCYDTPQAQIFNHVVSSYTPTLSALISPARAQAEFRGVLAVGQEAAAGSVALPGTVIELDKVQERAAQLHFTRLEHEHATIDAVLRAIEEHSWVHLACHASQDISDPLASAFQLYDGKLSLATITRRPLQHAEFAFLSACQTATGDESLPDEAVHLAAGMLMVGYSGVIATMWSIDDQDAPMIADSVYADILQGGVPDSSGAARALHKATEILRAQTKEEELARWIPYIHMGR